MSYNMQIIKFIGRTRSRSFSYNLHLSHNIGVHNKVLYINNYDE